LKTKSFLMILTVGVSFFLASCGSASTATTYAISGTISGLSSSGLVLQDNGGDNLSVSAGSNTFVFPTALVSGVNYAVTVLTQPASPAQTCVVAFGTGTVTASVADIQITCTDNTFTLGGTVSGLSGTGLVLQDNGSNNLSISANGSFSFPTPIPRGNGYNVTVLTQPTNPAQTCDVTNGFGTNINGNASDILVTCFTTTVIYTISGNVSGLSGTGLVLQNNSGNNLPISTNGNFTFSTPIASGSTYSVTVLTQPSNPAQNCVVTAGGGTANANVAGIQVTCTTVPFTIGGTITGLTSSGLVLQDNGGDSLPVSAAATSFTFDTLVPSGSSYAVTVLTQPSGPTCFVTNGSGTVASASVTNITINCSGSSFNISATASGLLPNTSVVLQDNGGDNLTISANNIATNFNTPLAGGASYAVTVLTQPAGATCTVGANASGKVASANINVAVTCGTVMAAAEEHTCAITGAGGVLCWGLNSFGQLGNGAAIDSNTPVPVVAMPSGVVSIAAGAEFTCALTNAGAVWCWGNNSSGQLGNGTFTPSSIPVRVSDPAGDAPLSGVVAIAAGQYHSCAVTDAGAALCWGDNSKGELGNGTDAGSNLPIQVSGLSSGVATISAGSYFTCAVTSTSAALCWGAGDSGQLGNGNSSGSTTPVAVIDTKGDAVLNGVVAIASGFENNCALTNGGTLLCWGANNQGQLGAGIADAQSNIPVEVMDSTGQSALNGVVAISGGMDDFCALSTTGTVACWGQNEYGQLGGGSTAGSSTPVPVLGLSSGMAAIVSGYQYNCAVSSAGTAECWGLNLDGQFGNGSTSNSPNPASVVGIGQAGLLKLF
jgi:alpha-tubulin suppressor-like RCC1 family protein